MKSLLLLAVFAVSIPSVHAEGFSEPNASDKSEKSVWDSANHPKIILKKNYLSKFTSLPLSGTVKDIPWSDGYWPRYRGGITQRWQSGVSGYKYETLKKSDVKNLTQEQIKALSPAEKFDLLKADYKFPLTQKVKRTNSPTDPTWQGICHGWSQAAIHHPKAKPITLKNRHGLSIPFGASDVHALYSYYYGKVKIGGTKMMGSRCGTDSTTPACKDVNAGAFHVVLGNLIGLQQKSFVLDVTQTAEVWNQPAHSYSSTVMEEREPTAQAAVGTVKEVKVKTRFKYVLEAGSSWTGSMGPSVTYRDYIYWLELNDVGEIIGGSWEGKHPDFLWVGTKAKLWGKFSTLKKLL